MLSRAEIDRREVVYLVSDGDAVKIGVSANIEQRLKNLKSQYGSGVRFIRSWPCRYAREAEGRAHLLLEPFKRTRPERLLEREWFHVPIHVAISSVETALMMVASNRR